MSTYDWTAENGRSNSSKQFEEITAAVARIIHANAAALIGGRANDVARQIVANLAHTFGMTPPIERSVEGGDCPTCGGDLMPKC